MKGFLPAALAALLLGLPAAPAAAEDPPKDDASLPKFRFEAVLHDYEPLSDRATRVAELYWAGVTADWTRGIFSVRAEVRGTEGTFRPFFDGSIWLEEGWVSVKTPAGALRAGKVVPLVGLPDETFPGNLFSLNGVTRNPGWGAQLDGEAGGLSTRSPGRPRSSDRTTTWAGRRRGATSSRTPCAT